MSDKMHAVRGQDRPALATSRTQTVPDRSYNLSAHQNTMYGVTVDSRAGYATAGYERKKNVCLQGSTDKRAAYAVLDKTFK